MRSFLIRIFFCLLFILTVLYINSYHGELINNAQVQWQYLKGKKGKIFLAIDVYAPSGIKIANIFSHGADITDSWRLINYPDWYKGRENFKKLSAFQEALHPYLPYNKDINVLYTNGWYTFLYEWVPKGHESIPQESSIKIKYQNTSTQNHYHAEHVSGVKIFSRIIALTARGPLINLTILYPFSSYEDSHRDTPNIIFDNLMLNHDGSNYLLKDLNRNEYSVYIRDKSDGGVSITDSLKGTVRWDMAGAYQVYSKNHETTDFKGSKWRIDFNELLAHIAISIFMGYFVFICWRVGLRFAMRQGIIFNSYADKLILPTFLGIIILTYLFFAIGVLKLLYFPLLLAVLALLLFCGLGGEPVIPELKSTLTKGFDAIKHAPLWILFLILLLGMLFYNFSYSFVPATYTDGLGDIENSYLPNLNGYIISHSFAAPIENSTYGTVSQTLDVLRTVLKVFIGEPGVYLLSFTYLALMIGGIYLIGKEGFGIKIKGMLIYLSLLLFLSANLFTRGIHLGKLHIGVLSFLLISLYSMRFANHGKNYLLPALFLSFLSSQYINFIAVSLAYYFFIIVCDFYRHRTLNDAAFRLHTKSLMLFFLLATIFNLKLILEVGICFPPWIISAWLRDIFVWFNRDNNLYRYFDNNYIRYFYTYHGLTREAAQNLPRLGFIGAMQTIYDLLDFKFIFLLMPLLKMDKYRILYTLEAIIILIVIGWFDPRNIRLSVYYIFPLAILQLAIIDNFISKYGLWYLRFKIWLILLLLFIAFFDISASGIRLNHLKISEKQVVLDEGIRSNEEHFREVISVFSGQISKYQYLQITPLDTTMNKESSPGAEQHFNHAMLIRQYTDHKDRILIVPVRFHSHAMRFITARHALGSVIYQKDINKIMADLKKLNINYLSFIPVNYEDYNPFYTPIFENDIFYKYFKLLFSANGNKFYKVIYDGTNNEYTPSPYNVKGLPFIPAFIE